MGQSSPTLRWFGQPIDPFDEPWYRFGRVLSLVERCTAIPMNAKWLDVGCQIGQFIKFLQARQQIVAAGIDDFDEKGVREICRKYFHIEIKDAGEVFDGSWRYRCRRIDKVGFDIDERFSFVSALEVLEHMIDTDAFLRECHEHLEAGGHLVISTPNLHSLRNRVKFPFGGYPSGMEYRTVVHHVRLYNATVLISHFKEHGFELEAISGVNFLPIKFIRQGRVTNIDARLADYAASLCGNIIAVFRAVP